MRRFVIALIFLATFILGGCGKAVPADRQAYVGEWQSDGMAIRIEQAGKVIYVRESKGSESKITAPLQSFEGNDFIIGLGPMKTRFKVSVPPHEDNGEWKMTVDGVELTRANE